MPTAKTAVIYARYSSSSQTEQSIEGQLHDAYEFAEKNGYKVINEYIDRAKTGTSDSRPSFQRMIKDSDKKHFDTVIVWKQDRFARNRYDSAVYKRILKNNGVKVVSVMENITDSPEGVILEGLLESMAEYYSANLSENIKRGKAESVRKGLFPGGPVAFGYQVKDKRLVPDPRTAPIVKEIFQRYADGEKIIDIERDLNARGIRARRGAKFQRSSVVHILENKTYSGDYYYGDTLVRDAVEPLIDRETFERAQANKEKNRRAPAANRTPESPCLLLHKLYCGECGNKMTGGNGMSTKQGKPHMYRYYACDGRERKHTKCGMKRVTRDEMHYSVSRIASDFLLNKKKRTLEILADSLMKLYVQEIDTSEIKDTEKQYAQIERDLDKLVDSLIAMPESARPRIAARMEELEAQKNDIETRLMRMRAETDMRYSRDDFVNALRVKISDLHNRESQKFIIDNFINSVYLYNDGRVVVYFKKLPGLPDVTPEDNLPGKDGCNSGTNITIPPGIIKAKPFSYNSSLYTYAPENVCKEEYCTPLLFFLHGRVGIMLWRIPPQKKTLG